MLIEDVIHDAIEPALALLPQTMDTLAARVMLLAIGMQESRFAYRYQIVPGRAGAKGPARGFWQFERGSEANGGGVWGVALHGASRAHLRALARARGIGMAPALIWQSIEDDDVLAAGLARLLLWTDPMRLPPIGAAHQAWELYLHTWRPGKPRADTWPIFYDRAVRALGVW